MCIGARYGYLPSVSRLETSKILGDDGGVRELYFAYGSNLSGRRLGQRVPGARALGAAELDAYRLTFNKPSSDGSGKANLVSAPGAKAWGVVWSLPASAWRTLDGFEPGYARRPCRVRGVGGEWHSAQVYLWLAPGPEQPPFASYLEHLREGAREHGLPAEFLEQLSRVDARPDPEKTSD
jgi:hypothetical protein